MLTNYDKQQIIRTAWKNCRTPLTEIKNLISVKISVSTVRRVLTAEGYHRRVAQRVPFLTPNHKHLRRFWGTMNKQRTHQSWHRVIFSDECYVHLGDKHGRIFMMRRKDEQLFDECVVPTFKQSAIRVMVWECIVEGRKGPLVVMEYPGGKGGGMNSKRYQEQVLEGPLLAFFTRLRQERGSIQFQQDGAPCHQSKQMRKWLDDHHIPLFYHPPNSPDLSPIEPVWLELKNILRSYRHVPSNVDKLKAAVLKAWDEISLDTINTHISSMPDCVAAVLAAKGGHTQF